MKRAFTLAAQTLSIQGCVSTPENSPISREELEVKTYTYTNLVGDKGQIWQKARNYLASTYNNSNAILRVSDEEEGTLIGKGALNGSFQTNLVAHIAFLTIKFVLLPKTAKHVFNQSYQKVCHHFQNALDGHFLLDMDINKL